jgi:YfiH family protein
MERIISPELFGYGLKAIFTGKTPGVDLRRIARIVSVEKKNIYMPIQRHTDTVSIVDADLTPKVADAVVTRTKGILIGVQTADCVPMLLYDGGAHVVAAVHAGWRGTASGILRKTISVLTDRFCSSPSQITIAIGPSIRGCCYRVGSEVIEAVKKATGEGNFFRTRGETNLLDLQSANRYQALSMGISEKNIWLSPECTHCLPDKYYSYRFAKGPTGRQGGFIGMGLISS